MTVTVTLSVSSSLVYSSSGLSGIFFRQLCGFLPSYEACASDIALKS